jgi:hypothetical protein
MSALLKHSNHDPFDIDEPRPAEHRFPLSAVMIGSLFTVGTVATVLMLLAQA